MYIYIYVYIPEELPGSFERGGRISAPHPMIFCYSHCLLTQPTLEKKGENKTYLKSSKGLSNEKGASVHTPDDDVLLIQATLEK